MNKTQALAIVGGLSRPSKMPGNAYSLPARECKTGGKLRNVAGSTCANCYALKGRYLFRNVQSALYRRLKSIRDPQWCDAMVTAIGEQPYFRWHDSGDIQSVAHLRKIAEVCERTPGTRHWLPTREKRIVRDYTRRYGDFPANLCIRISAAMIDACPPPGFANTSTVHDANAPIGHACPAPLQGNQCGDCRACWDTSISNVSYGRH